MVRLLCCNTPSICPPGKVASSLTGLEPRRLKEMYVVVHEEAYLMTSLRFTVGFCSTKNKGFAPESSCLQGLELLRVSVQ